LDFVYLNLVGFGFWWAYNTFAYE